jgi:hypothetical protein
MINKTILQVSHVTKIDIGWLQNPIYYADAQSKIIIRYLPAFYPAQVSMISAFTDHSILRPCLVSMIYGIILLILALVVFWYKIRTYRQL